MVSSLRTLLAGLIDYAGLFPPAGLDMETAVHNYASYRDGKHGWMLGRFVVPSARLAEFDTVARRLPGPWPLSVLDYDGRGSAVGDVEAVEIRNPCTCNATDVLCFIEVPLDEKLDESLRLVSAEGAGAKIRTGGVTPETIPSTSDVARFLTACADAPLAFKATAGLHHATRCVRPLTYAADSPEGRMHGFLNVFLAAAFVHQSVRDVAPLLDEESADAFRFEEGYVSWRNHRISTMEIAQARTEYATSFGSCSFEEPIADLREAGLLTDDQRYAQP